MSPSHLPPDVAFRRPSARLAPLLAAVSRLVPALGAAAALAAGGARSASAQIPPTLEPDPSLPVAEGFDVERAILWARPQFAPMHDPRWESLREAVRDDRVSPGTPMVLFEAGGRTLTLVSSQLAYHHVAQGVMAGEPWMVTF